MTTTRKIKRERQRERERNDDDEIVCVYVSERTRAGKIIEVETIVIIILTFPSTIRNPIICLQSYETKLNFSTDASN